MGLKDVNAARIADNDQSRATILDAFVKALNRDKEGVLQAICAVQCFIAEMQEDKKDDFSDEGMASMMLVLAAQIGLMAVHEKLHEAIESGKVQAPEGW
jgi:hypothetical protein